MKRFYLAIIMWLVCQASTAQESAYSVNWTTEQADSVKRELRIASNDTLRMKMARSLAVYYQEINRDTSLFYVYWQMDLAKKLNQKLWETDAYDAAGWLLAQLKNYSLAIEYLLTAARMAEDKNTEKNIWQLSLFSKDQNPEYARITALGFIYNDLSQLYRQAGDITNEMALLRRGIVLGNQIGNKVLLAILKSNLSQVNLNRNYPDSVIYFGLQSLDHMKQSDYKTYEGYQLNLLAEAYMQKRDWATAKSYLDESITANQANRSTVKLPDTYMSYAQLYQLLNKPDSSITFLRKAVAAFTSFNLSEKIKKAYGLLYTGYKEKNEPDSAYHYLQLYQSLSDSLAEAEKKQIHAYQHIAFNKQIEQQEQESRRIQKANTNRTYAFLAGILFLVLIAFLLFRNNQTRRKANKLLYKQKAEIEEQKTKAENALAELKVTQSQLIQSEKMASLGELTAGIAHEIQNPLNFVNNFSEVSNELITELKEERQKAEDKRDKELEDELLNDISINLEKINHHGKRADAIVKSMLQHSRSSSGQKESTDINALCDEYLRLSYHGLRAKDKSFNATLNTDFDESIGNIPIIPQDMGRVLMNLITNAFYAVNEQQKKKDKSYEPAVWVQTRKTNTGIEIKVADNGNGIPKHIIDKIFQPFFTTKPTGQGTGLGLSLAYDIVKAHGGELNVSTIEGEGSHFLISLPIFTS